MLEQKIHHLPVREDDGRIVGVITDTDLLRHQLKSPLHMLQMLERLRTRRIQRIRRRDGRDGRLLFQGNLDVLEIGRIVASLNDAAVKQMLRFVEQKLGLAAMRVRLDRVRIGRPDGAGDPD